MREIRNKYELLVGKFIENMLLGKPRYEWNEDPKTDLRVMSCSNMA
jgi:hypothetical protein